MPTPKLKTTEADLREQIRTLCKLYGWLMYFTWNSRNSPSGFPDLVLVNPQQKRVVFAELKGKGKMPTPAQQDWLDCLKACGQEVEVWRPDDINRITWLLQPQEHKWTATPPCAMDGSASGKT